MFSPSDVPHAWGALFEKFEGLLEDAAASVRAFINEDDDIRKTLDPNNEYVRFPDGPLTWEQLLQKGVRENYFTRKFRFDPANIEKLVKGLRFPEILKLSYKKGTIESRLALAILLHFLAFPVRQENDMEEFWRMDRRKICTIIDDTCMHIFKTWRHLLWPGDVTRIKNNFPRWREAISRKLGLSPGDQLNLFGFIDGTMREMCKPGGPFINQESVWDGHHYMPALGYLGVITPDGLFALFFGPVVGAINDHSMVCISELLSMLEGGLFGEGAEVYGDLGFVHCGGQILTAFTHEEAGDVTESVNSELNSHRTSVEWGFGKVVNTFRTHSFTPVQKPKLSRIAVWYLVSVILMNCQVCIYGSEAAEHFNCPPPTLEEYLRAEWHEDPAFAEAIEKYRPQMYPMRLREEKWTKWNTDQKEWAAMQRMGLEEYDPNKNQEGEGEEKDKEEDGMEEGTEEESM